MKFKFIFLLSLFLVLFLFSCDQITENVLDGVEIGIEDTQDVPAGVYVIPFEISNLDTLISMGVTFTIEITDQDDHVIEVTEHSFIVEEGLTYTVTLSLRHNDLVINKTAIITAVSPTVDIYHQVTYQLSGGTSNTTESSVLLGDLLEKPADPTKEGFVFSGWFLDSSYSIPYDFSLPVVLSFTLTAKWDQEFTVTYHLNGAPQSGSATEIVIENQLADGPSITPVWENRDFLGWALDSEGLEMWNFDIDLVTSNITLYAIWQHNKLVYYDDGDYIYFMKNTGGLEFNIDFPRVLDQSTINATGNVEMIKSIEVAFKNYSTKTELDLNGEIISIRLVYAYDKELFDLNDPQNVVLYLDDFTIQSTMRVTLDTEPLLGNKTYSYAYVVEYLDAIIVSNIYTLETPHLVSSGESMGSDIISGGHYVVSLWRDYNHPNYEDVLEFKIYTDSGFISYVGDFEYFNTIHTIRQTGYHTYTSKNTDTDEEYLHVIHVLFDPPRVLFELETISMNQQVITVNFALQMNQVSISRYTLDSYGIIASTTHPLLKIDIPNTNQYEAQVNLNSMLSVSFDYVESSYETLYIRPYAIIGGRVDYSLFVYEFTYDEGLSKYVFAKTIHVDVSSRLNQLSYSASFFPTTLNVTLYTLVNNQLLATDFVGNIDFNITGQHFLIIEDSNVIYDIQGIALEDILGVSDQGVYDGSVLVENPNNRNYLSIFYIIYEGEEDAIYLPDKVLITRKGIHKIYYETNDGIKVVTIEII